jgi:hypothetical protein
MMAKSGNSMKTFMNTEQEEDLLKPVIYGDKPVQKAFRLTPSQAHELKKFCAAENITMQEAILAGINMLMRSKGLPPI